MNRKSSYQGVSLDELLDGSMKVEKPSKKGNKALGVVKYLTASIAVAVAASTLVVPGARLISFAADSGIDFYYSLPDNTDFVEKALPQHTILKDKNGTEFARFFSENREKVELDQVTPSFTKALIASEDSRFYEHGGFDPVGTARALVNNAKGGMAQGGSTLTQQLVKNMLVLTAAQSGEEGAVDTAVTGSRDYLTKLKELRLSVALEDKYTKDEILNLYINSVYFGNGAYGIKAASNQYFGVNPDKLTISQSATLVAIVQSPNVYNPIDNAEVSLQQRNLVLGRMRDTNAITKAEYDKALKEKVVVKTTPLNAGCGKSKYAHYCQYVISELKKNPVFGNTQEARDARLAQGGLTITTALDPVATDKANDEIMKAIGEGNRVAVASATIEPGTGKITALAQSRPWGNGDFQTEINYPATKFSVGSSFKPFTIAAALEQGMNPRETIFSSPSYYHSPSLDGPPDGYSNYGWYNYGNTDMYRATQLSLNTYYIKLLEKVGVHNLADMAKKLGIKNLPPTESFTGKEGSLTLGAHELTAIEMADAYATFASGGLHCDPVSILSAVKTETGEKVKVPGTNCQQVITPAVAHGVSDVLKEDFKDPGTAKDADLANGRIAAGKTGTTENYAETWFVGYTPQYSTAVWIGDPRGGQKYPLDVVNIFGRTFTSATGEDIAAPVWRNIMNRLHEGLPKVGFPAPGRSPVTSVPALSVPNVQGMEINKAVTLLDDAGFAPEIAAEADKKDGLPTGIVVAQTPSGGGIVDQKSKVTLTLSKGSDTKMTITERGDK
jgi:membrane peptidoglycan carboxypeptidase